MKKIYWRPHQVSKTGLFLIALLAIGGMIAVESFRVQRRQPHYREKMIAARLARTAMEVVKQERLRRKLPIDPEVDPARSGLIGLSMSTVTSDTGYLSAKHTSINPNFAAVIIQLLKRVDVAEGDIVAVGPSGSFPALNIAAYAAIQTLKLKPIIISSAAASQWGANMPELLWIDMERILVERHIFTFRSLAASIGGVEDRGFGMSKEGKDLLEDSILRNGLQMITSNSAGEGVATRMQLYEEQAGGYPIKAYINIGGGTASVGTAVGKKLFKAGLNRTPPRGSGAIDSVMMRFASEGVPVIHLIRVSNLAERYGFPLQPKTMPNIGEGKVFVKEEYNSWLTLFVLFIILGGMFAFIRMDLGFRIFSSTQRDKPGGHPEQMI